jgi:hypothetical protein
MLSKQSLFRTKFKGLKIIKLQLNAHPGGAVVEALRYKPKGRGINS